MKIIFNSPPEAKARPRSGKHGFYDPKAAVQKVHEWEAKTQIGRQGLLKPIESPICLGMTLYVPMPKTWSKKRKETLFGKPVPTKPDLDNYLKFYMDALKGSLYKDDNLVTQSFQEKIYSDDPRVEIVTSEHSESLLSKIERLSMIVLAYEKTITEIENKLVAVCFHSSSASYVEKFVRECLQTCRNALTKTDEK